MMPPGVRVRSGAALRLGRRASLAADTGPQRYALLFPSNVTGSSQSSPYGVIEFANPQNNGFPTRGPSNSGWTVIRRVKPLQQTGYYAQFWYSRADGQFQGSDFYFGCHPYPQNGQSSGTTHYWEIATEGGDMLGYDDNNNPQTVTKGQWYLQAFKLEYLSGTNQCRFWFWPNLPNVSPASGNIIRWTSQAGYGGTTPPTPKITIGNSPWMAGYQEERASCHHGQIKIIMADLTQQEILDESANMNVLVTTKAQNNIWWGKKGFTSINDLTCDFGTGRSFVRNDSQNILTLGEAL